MEVISRLITIVWTVIGLTLISIFVAVLTVSLTVIVTESRSVLYGAKVGLSYCGAPFSQLRWRNTIFDTSVNH